MVVVLMTSLADFPDEVRVEVGLVREHVAALHAQLIKWGLVVWTAGNVSQRLHSADLLVIKPSGVRYEQLTPWCIRIRPLRRPLLQWAGRFHAY